MIVQWQEATVKRTAYFADVNGRRLHVEQTVRSFCAHGIVDHEYQACVGGVRIGEFPSLVEAQEAAERAAETKTAPQDDRGAGCYGFDYREFQPAFGA